ncbi:SH3 domain-containing protein [Jannaschia pohangensis]|uniref:SH3 domain protein n=1 Tax=Jannaschia pohangensis TaxID=390807 RepID=A0A1I3SS90_9RHOB|nr:SH3 domain-containing protein [Jannaschia pohangensis]SFJ60451.1 SH3 domain protein [Jannaschia pohangensis]
MRLATLLLVLLLSPLGAMAQTLFVSQNDDGYLNLRSGPGTRFDILRRLSPGDSVAVLETVGRWYRVRVSSGQEGWVAGDFLERGPAIPKALFVDQTNDGYLNLRAGPGVGHPILRRMYPGDRLTPLATSGNWVQVRHVSGAVGWAHSGYISP